MRQLIKNRRLLCLAVAVVAIAAAASLSYAGGPLLVNNGHPITWQRTEVRGGPLNTQTVDPSGVVQYRLDSGPLGPLSNDQARALADRIFGLYNSIPTSTIRFNNAGPILDPSTGQPVDVNGANFGRFIGRTPTFQNPIIFDSDGSITNDPSVLGFFSFLTFDLNADTLQEAFVVLNGQPLTRHSITTTSFLGVFTHEFGHFVGPLDHEQINGNIASDGAGSVLPAGFSRAQAYDLYAPFTETLFPFLFDAPPGSQLAAQFQDSGFFVASLDMDTMNAVSDLYPTPAYQSTTGSIEGQVLVQAGSAQIPVTGINVVARRIDQGAYPPAPTVTAFSSPPVIDPSSGVPQAPQAQAATDSLATVSSAVTGLQFGNGTYRIQGLPPGNYLVSIEQINPDATQGSSIGPLTTQATLPVVEEFFNGPSNSSNSVSVFSPITVTAGQVTTGVNFMVNGLSTAPLTPVSADGNNHLKKTAQAIPVGSEVTGTVSDSDPSQLRVDFGGGNLEFVSDLYKFTVTTPGIFFITLDGTSGTPGADIDLFLWDSAVNKKRSSPSDPNLVSGSFGPTIDEMVAVQLTPGTYFIGVASAQGTETYKLRLIPSQ